MPIYEYVCEKCGTKFELMQKINEDPISTCIYCSGNVSRLISPSAFIFKGTGWYVTDYARKGTVEKDKDVQKEDGGKSKTPECETKSPECVTRPSSNSRSKD